MKFLFASLVLAVAAAGCGNTIAAERMIEKQVVVPASIEEVWSAWTTREGVKSFFAPDAIVEPRSFGLFEMHMNPYAEPGMRGADDMRFLALQKPTMLSFTWNAPPHQPEIRAQRTVVIVRLRAVDGKSTEVTLRQVGWGEGEKWDETYKYFDRAWGNVLANLQKRFTDGPIDFTPFLERLKAQPADRK
jgi:uncharacterized protein YndB with AHSA1/START domain